ncbi:CoA transferase, partial [Catellatospora coxensis]|uniref:CoA transferase n=1 Tax=Catellatospora coxensis TaxID=310354 RepID=UPI0031D5AD0E
PTGPLAGVKVVDISTVVMGPYATQILGDFGADVIRIEPPFHTARTSPANTGRNPGMAPLYMQVNRNKRSVQLDIAGAVDRDIALTLIDSADVVLENFRVGRMESLGFGYEELAARNPRLIYCSLKGFLTGPYGERTALDEVVQMLGGLAFMTGPPGQPLRAGASVNDIMGGMFG